MDPFKTLIIGTPPSRTFTADATGLLTAANNLSDVADAQTALNNLGAGTNLNLTGATSTITLGAATEIVTLAVDASGGLTVTPKAGQFAQVYGATGATFDIHANRETAGDLATLRMSTVSSATSDYRKGAIFYKADGSGYGRGDFVFAIDNTETTAAVSPSNAILTLFRSGNAALTGNLTASGSAYFKGASSALFSTAGLSFLSDSSGRGLRFGTSDYDGGSTGSSGTLEFSAGTGTATQAWTAYAGGVAGAQLKLTGGAGGGVEVTGAITATSTGSHVFGSGGNTVTLSGQNVRVAANTNGAARGLEFYNSGNSTLFGTIKSDYTTGIIAYDAGAAAYGGSHVFTSGTTSGSVTLAAGAVTATSYGLFSGLIQAQVANGTLGAKAASGVFVRDNNGALGTIAQIGFGYNGTYLPVSIGAVVTDATGNTQADFIVATRTGTSDAAPTERMRISGATGNATFAGSVAAAVAEYADNAAAVTAGLAVGTFYRTGDVLKVVHA